MIVLPRGRTKVSRRRGGRSRRRRSAKGARKIRHVKTISPSMRQRANGVHRRADSSGTISDEMRHRMRRSLREWEKIGASVQILEWIRERVSITFKKATAHPSIRPRSVVNGRQSCSIIARRPACSELRPCRSLVALYLRPLRITTLPSVPAGQQRAWSGSG
jgi:transcription initiation factor TFIIIB Brf1 subunit/transcription initiation factor TFIIB